ncbi:glycerol kinase GlpK [Haloglycomyces albus]|uniref:glycerol kinase GlpK n=1 Tax=Haloglycomyces albus TaxID=526067 RepID=UPI00046CCE73|nr:glycerol kinase GlpK [Haloglycomyces albus]
MSQQYIAAIDQGTSSSRCIIFDHAGTIVAVDQKEHRQIYPQPGWVEHDAVEIRDNVDEVVEGALTKSGIAKEQVAAIGITNQRETTVIWDKETGEPVYNAIVWLDTRTDDIVHELSGDEGADRFRDKCGLPLATYFSGPKIRWLLDNVEGLRERAERGEVLFGTMDTWVIWNLTGGVHAIDVSNASRTMLMDLGSLDWDQEILDQMGIPAAILPEIRSSSEIYGEAKGPLSGVPVASALGDQQAALFGQTCFAPGEAKSTYGTGTFMLLNTGERPVMEARGSLTTVAYQLGDAPATYALEGSIAVTGALVQWLRDNLGLISSAPEIETLARTVEDNGGCYVVPAFSGLFAPHWRDDARGVIVGLTGYIEKGHIARAALEAAVWQTREVADAMQDESGVSLSELRVDGGMTANNLLMQDLADVLDVPVIRPMVAETTCLGAAYAAGLAVGYWDSVESLRENWHKAAEWSPDMDSRERDHEYHQWKKAVSRTLDWVERD